VREQQAVHDQLFELASRHRLVEHRAAGDDVLTEQLD
jgi:hypothetical protein